jgi:hypothetical protein
MGNYMLRDYAYTSYIKPESDVTPSVFTFCYGTSLLIYKITSDIRTILFSKIKSQMLFQNCFNFEIIISSAHCIKQRFYKTSA